MGADLPTGTVTFLFTDIEGSTRLLHALGPDAYAEALTEHRRLLREAFAAHEGVEVDTQGDAFFVAFPTAEGAARAALAAQDTLRAGSISVRMACTPALPRSSRRATSVSTCTEAREWPRLRTAARSSARRRLRRCWTATRCAISACIG
jgi:hypothetical protein